MIKKSNIVLIGFMGTGKSTIGKSIAKRLDLAFIDIDMLIESRMNQTISGIFEKFGEKYFRELEKKVVKEYSEKEGQVISTGGGVVLDVENMENLKSSGIVIMLKARPEIIFRNVSKDQNRPLLKSDDPMERIIELLEKRQEYYKNNHYEIEVSDLAVDDVVNEVIRIYDSN